MTIYFLKDILARRKAYVPNQQVKTLFVPQYKNLSIDRILEFVADKPHVSDFFPDDIDLPKVPKQWLVNICAVVLGDEFRAWVHHQMEERNAVMCAKKEMMITMDPEMAAKFAASTHLSRKCLSTCLFETFHVQLLNSVFQYSLQRCVGKHAQDQLQA